MKQPDTFSKPISVCHILPALPAHGAEQLLLDIARNTDGRKLALSICLISDLGPLVGDFERLGIPVTFLPKESRFDITIIWRLARFLKKNRFDLVHTHLFTADLWGRLASLPMNIGVLSTSHTTSDPNVGWLGRLLDRMLGYRNDAMICVSEAVRQYRRDETGVTPEKFFLIENGIDLCRFEKNVSTEEMRHRLGLAREGFWIAIIGRLIPLKGHRNLIRALSLLSEKLPALGIVVVGEGETETALKRQAEKAGLSGRVVFLGLRRDVPDILQAVDVLAIPSSREGLPIVLLEAMAAGLPVVASKVGGMPEVVLDGETGILVEQDPFSIAQALKTLFENSVLRKKMGETARKVVEERYDIRKVAERYEGLYRSITFQRSIRRSPFKKALRSFVGRALSGLEKIRASATKGTYPLRILMYHRVSNDLTPDILNVTPFQFEEQMRWLREKGFSVLPLDSALEGLRSGSLPPGAVSITFDDGTRDNFDHAFPILKKMGYSACFFPVTDFVLGEGVHPRYKDRMEKVLYLSEEHIRKISSEGMLIGCHSKTHALLGRLSEEEASTEILDSKELLESWTNDHVRFLAYPNGSFHPRLFPLLNRYGFSAAVSTNPGLNTSKEDLWMLKRTEISGRDTLRDFGEKMEGSFDALNQYSMRLKSLEGWS